MSVVGNGKPATEESRLDRDSSVARFKKTKSPIAAGTVQPVDVLHDEVYDDGYLHIEHQNYYLTCDGEPVYLPRVEFLLLSRLARSMERVVPSEDLWRAAWGADKPLNGGSLHVYIHRLRNNLRPYHLRIDALVNVGYRLLTNK